MGKKKSRIDAIEATDAIHSIQSIHAWMGER